MIYSLKNYKEKDELNSDVIKFNWLQTKFQCCGVVSNEDWKVHLSPNHIIYKIIGNTTLYIDDVPDTCCKNQSKNCGKIYSDKKDEMVYTPTKWKWFI